MLRINGNQITPGTVIDHDGGLWVAVKTNAVKPGKGGAFNQAERRPRHVILKIVEAGPGARGQTAALYAAGGLDRQATAIP